MPPGERLSRALPVRDIGVLPAPLANSAPLGASPVSDPLKRKALPFMRALCGSLCDPERCARDPPFLSELPFLPRCPFDSESSFGPRFALRCRLLSAALSAAS